MDDIKPPRTTGQSPAPTNYGRVPAAPQQLHDVSYGGVQNTVGNDTTTTQPEEHHQSYTLPEHSPSSKGTKVALVLFILLFIAASAFAGWQFMQLQDANAEIAELQTENNRLNERVYSLNYDNRDLSQQLELSNSEAAALQEENAQLQEECGSSCDNITP